MTEPPALQDYRRVLGPYPHDKTLPHFIDMIQEMKKKVVGTLYRPESMPLQIASSVYYKVHGGRRPSDNSVSPSKCAASLRDCLDTLGVEPENVMYLSWFQQADVAAIDQLLSAGDCMGAREMPDNLLWYHIHYAVAAFFQPPTLRF